MSIEQDINQPKFRNLYQKATVNFIFTFNWRTEKIKCLFDSFDITPQQFNILRILRGAKTPLSTLQIRQRMLDKMSDTSRIVDRMVIKGFVKKTTSKKDKRLVEVSITNKGQKLLTHLDSHQDEIDGVFNNLNEKEIELFSNLLDKIREEK
jgi:DNA-binding MarR family transcriptional regulator